jgi:charged multivesicular body protein 1
MWNTNTKLLDQIFELKFASKQLVKESRKAESEEKAQKTKAKTAMEKGELRTGRT